MHVPSSKIPWAWFPTEHFHQHPHFLFSFLLFSSHSSGTWPSSALLSVSWAPYLWELYARNIEQPCCARIIMRACTCIHSAVRLDCVSRVPEATLGKNLSLLEEHVHPLYFSLASLPPPFTLRIMDCGTHTRLFIRVYLVTCLPPVFQNRLPRRILVPDRV
jgi:hypothetical protein